MIDTRPNQPRAHKRKSVRSPHFGVWGLSVIVTPTPVWVPWQDTKPDEIGKAPGTLTHSPAMNSVAGIGAGVFAL